MNIKEKILDLKKKRNAIILSHFYQDDEVQEIADFTGDSFALSLYSKNSKADVIVFAGVYFMAEVASIISPEKIVLLPDLDAGCPMASMIKEKDLLDLKEKHKDAFILTYINSTARIKAMSDAVCTSSNANTIVKNIKNKNIIFIPDKNLASFVQKYNPDKNIILFNGYCHVHENMLKGDLEHLKSLYKDALVVSHPECNEEILKLSDEVASTGGMLRFVKDSKNRNFIICTEKGILYKMKKENPDKNFYHISKNSICPNMKKTTLEKILFTLEDMKNIIKVDKNISILAKKAIDNMFLYSK